MSDARLEAWLRSQTWPDLRASLQDGDVVAYEHPYGFTVCRVRSYFPGWEMRIHLWPSRVDLIDSMSVSGTYSQLVHAHGWDLMSVVVVGAMEETRFAVQHSASSDQALYKVRSDYGVGLSRMSLVDESVSVAQLERVSRHRGDGVFQIRQDTFHSSLPTRTECVTLVATEVSDGPSYVVAPRGLGPASANARRPIENLDVLTDRFDAAYSTFPGDSWAAFVFIVHADHVLLVRTARRPDQWQPVGGRQEAGDLTPVDTVLREVREEIGLALTTTSIRPVGKSDRDVGDGTVYFWLSEVGTRPMVAPQVDELLDHKWVPLSEAATLDMYPAAARALIQIQQ